MAFSTVEAGRDRFGPPAVASWRPIAAALSKPANAVFLLIVAGSVIRVAMAAAVGLGSDESYAVANARMLALSYVDYPPLHAWLVWAWVSLTGSEAPWVVRLPFIALFAGSTWMMFRLTGFLFGARAGAWAALAFNLAPVFAIPHASWVLADGPLIFFLLSAAYVVAKLLFEGGQPSADFARWLAAGVFCGLAMLAKFHGAFFLAGAFVFLLSWKPGRDLLARPAPWLGAVLALAIFTPVIVWNAGHDWAGLFFQTQRLATPHIEFGRVFASLAGQAAYLGPWIFVPLAYEWIISLARGPAAPRRWFLAMLASGPIFGFTVANIIAPGLPHWPMPGWLFLFPVLGAEAAALAQKRPGLMRGAACAAGAFLIALIGAFAAEARTGFLVAADPARYAHADPTIDLMDWTELPTILSQRGLLNAQTPAIAAVQWKEAGKLNYIMGRDLPVLCLCADPQEFRFQQHLGRFIGKNMIVVGAHRPPSEIARALDGRFARLETLAPVILHRAGQPAVELTIMRGIDFQPEGQK